MTAKVDSSMSIMSTADNANRAESTEGAQRAIEAAPVDKVRARATAAGACAMSLLLAAGTAMPALAASTTAGDGATATIATVNSGSDDATAADSSRSQGGNGAIPATSPTSDASAGASGKQASTPEGDSAPQATASTATGVQAVSQTVPLSTGGGSIPAESVAYVSAHTADRDSSTSESPEDAEVCTWAYDGSEWSTARGGQVMTVSDAVAFGIDVSEWQGSIDWARVKSSGVQYAILRCAYGSADSGHEDMQFAANVKGCKENGIPFGVYLYSNGSTAEDAAAEAQHAIEAMGRAGAESSDLVLPVYYDMEDDAQRNLSATERADMAQAFCDAIELAGYEAGIYASQSWFENLLTDERFDNWSKWVASYPSTGTRDASSSYTGEHDIWQCMSRGKIDGISTRVDINFDYRFGEAHYNAIYDYDCYMESNPDLADAFGDDRLAAFNHFMTAGMAEGRCASASFNLHGYFNSNVDLRREFGLDLKKYYLHYQESGIADGRSMEDSMAPTNLVRGMHVVDLSSIYDPYVYLANNDDLRERFTVVAQGCEYIDDAGLFAHFISTGLNEGRIAK